jgi:hypothetical protein
VVLPEGSTQTGTYCGGLPPSDLRCGDVLSASPFSQTYKSWANLVRGIHVFQGTCLLDLIMQPSTGVRLGLSNLTRNELVAPASACFLRVRHAAALGRDLPVRI